MEVNNPSISQLEPISITNAWQDLCLKGMKHLLDEYHNGFANTKHIMPFSPEIFQVQGEFQTADIFQRALILDTFIDVNAAFKNELQEIIDVEANYLIASRRKEGVGGWAYFPELRELPPDADDLAQVMQVLLKSGYRSTAASLFETPLTVLLRDQANADNGWESWIIPKENQTAEEQLQTVWVNKAWGTGSDIDVVANLLYALHLYDKDRFSKEIARGLDFLYSSHTGFSWKSTWYYGDNYGTYVSIKAICANKGDKKIIEGAVRFLEDSRRSDGGWGIEDQESNALQTALALLGIALGKDYLDQAIDSSWIETSLRYLQEKYTDSTGWESCPFIRMPMGRPSGFVHTILTYESVAITNNFVVKACNQLI
jgi:squalene cyclase